MSITEIGEKIIKREVKPPSPTKKKVGKIRRVSKRHFVKKKRKKIIVKKPKHKPHKHGLMVLKKKRPSSKPKTRKLEEEQPLEYRSYVAKEAFEKFGSGLMSQQYINVLFSQIGASYFLIGLFHGLKDLFSIITSIFVGEYLRITSPKKWVLQNIGILLGFSYLVVAIGIFNMSIYLVGITLVIMGVLNTFLGQVYTKSYVADIKSNPKLRNLPQYSVTLIGIALVIGGRVLNKYPLFGELIKFNTKFGIPGFFLLMSITAICLVISSQFLKRLVKVKRFEIKTSLWSVMSAQLKEVYEHSHTLFKNKVLLVALTAATMTGIVQTLGNIYYGLYIYKMFKYIGFGGFMNIAMIFIISLFSALMASTISKMLSKKYGNLPLLTFGTIMVAIQPLTYYFSPNLLSLSMATSIGVIGASLTGLAIGLLVTHALRREHRKKYYALFSFLITLPYAIFIPLGAYFAQVYGLKLLFLVLGLSLIFLVSPMYFILQITLGKQTA